MAQKQLFTVYREQHLHIPWLQNKLKYFMKLKDHTVGVACFST